MRFRTSLAVLLFATAFGFHLWLISRGWDSPTLSGHEFRQAQTGLSIWAMKQDGFRMDYSTPVLGKPWAIPFEFPVYQGVVYFVTKHSHLDLIPAGRLVSVIAFYLGIPAIVLLLRRLGLSRSAALVGVTPLFFAPVYVFYSRSVLIESTAFASGAWFLYCAIAYRQTRAPWLLTVTLFAGAVAVLTKATTWAVFCLPWAGFILTDLWHWKKTRARTTVLAVVDDVVLVGLPLLVIGFGWVWISDRIKEFNPIGAHLISRELRDFNFGTLNQRASLADWRSLWNHWNVAVMPWWCGALPIIAIWWTPKPAKTAIALGLAAFVGAPLVFFNLYAVHDYYFYANAWGLCLAVGAVAAGWWDHLQRGWSTIFAALSIVAVVGVGQYATYRNRYYDKQVQRPDRSLELSTVLKKVTRPEDVVVVHNPDWNSALPFWAERRMLMISDHQMVHHPEDVQRSVQLLAGESVPLVVFWGNSRNRVDWLLERARDFHLQWFPAFVWQGQAAVYAREDVFWDVRAILHREPVPGIEMPDAHQFVQFKPAEQISTAPAVSELAECFDPRPSSASLPYGVTFRYVEGKKYLFVHPPTQIEVPVPPGATRVELGCRIEPEAYRHNDFDGVLVTVELLSPDGTRLHLLEQALPAGGPRHLYHRVALLPKDANGTVIFRTLPGMGGNYAYDWALLEYLRVK